MGEHNILPNPLLLAARGEEA